MSLCVVNAPGPPTKGQFQGPSLRICYENPSLKINKPMARPTGRRRGEFGGTGAPIAYTNWNLVSQTRANHGHESNFATIGGQWSDQGYWCD